MQPAPTSTPPTLITARLGNLFPWRCDHPGPPVVDVPFAQGKEGNAAEGPKNVDDDLIRDEDYHGPPTPDPNLQQQQQAVAVQAHRHSYYALEAELIVSIDNVYILRVIVHS
ncbi:hypothetical protein EV702DRAFT_1266419 [Suillus placidus]|uniref:Uncharacterized protein n=1 Tax=Suillus placidus TaxID=48579 RepID=A0A9P7A175_9AGAM|nr:hypothetical protein EV702DRAFT_1266419 [Suillus placidus]